jgi:hypothetical protein
MIMTPQTSSRRLGNAVLLATALMLVGAPATAQDRLASLAKRSAAAKALTVDKASVSPAELVKTMGRKPEAQSVFFWVRDKISFEPYAGAQRGVRGTLTSRAGNAVDQALLLQALLKEAGYDARLTRGKLDKKSSINLLREFVGKAELVGATPENMPTYDPSRDRALLNALQDHYWVEAKLNGDWVPMDPTFHRSPFGVHPAQSEGGFKTLPDEDVVSMTIKIYVIEGDGSGGEVLSYTKPLPELSWRNVVLRFEQTDRKGVFKNPVLEIGGVGTKGRKFRAKNLNRVWVEFYTDRGGKAGDVVTRDLFVRDGVVDLFAADDQVFSILLAPGWMNRQFLKAVAQRQVPTLYDEAAAAAKRVEGPAGARLDKDMAAYTQSTLASAAGLVSLAYADVTDQIAMKLALTHGVRAWYAEPRIVIVAAVRKGDSIYWQIDLRNNTIKSVPAEGLPMTSSHAFQAVRGRFDSQFEGAVLSRLTGTPVTSTGSIFAASANNKAGYATLHPGNIDKLLDGLGLTVEATDRLSDAVRQRGKAALVPAAPVKVGGGTTTAWWELDLSGSMVGVREDGINGARFESSLLTGKPSAEVGEGTGATLFANNLRALDSLAGTLLALLGAVPNVCPVLCQCTADLKVIPALTCQKIGAKGKIDAAKELAACFEPEKPSDDFLNLKLGCEGTVKPARCGALMSVATLRGLYSVKYSVQPVGNRTGPWSPEELPPVDAGRCNCR